MNQLKGEKEGFEDAETQTNIGIVPEKIVIEQRVFGSQAIDLRHQNQQMLTLQEKIKHKFAQTEDIEEDEI